MKENNPHILGEAPIGKLLVEYSIPAIIGMTLTSLYNIIDSIFIGHGVGALAISGLAITFPLMNLLVAFCTLVGVGGATLSSIRLGQKDKKGAEDILGNVAILCVINAIFYGGLAFIFLEPILFFFGASEATLPYARDFMQVILLGSPISYVMIGLNNIMRATGYPKKAMLSSMLTVGCNIIHNMKKNKWVLLLIAFVAFLVLVYFIGACLNATAEALTIISLCIGILVIYLVVKAIKSK